MAVKKTASTSRFSDYRLSHRGCFSAMCKHAWETPSDPCVVNNLMRLMASGLAPPGLALSLWLSSLTCSGHIASCQDCNGLYCNLLNGAAPFVLAAVSPTRFFKKNNDSRLVVHGIHETYNTHIFHDAITLATHALRTYGGGVELRSNVQTALELPEPVSYTHLTLPTHREV